MGTYWQRTWLHLRLVGLAVIVVLTALLFLWNIGTSGRAQVLPWMSGHSSFWALAAAFVLGVFATRLYKASLGTWKEFQADRQRRRDEIAEEAVQKTLGNILKVSGQGQAAQQQEPQGQRPVPQSPAPLPPLQLPSESKDAPASPEPGRPEASSRSSDPVRLDATPRRLRQDRSAADVWTSGEEDDAEKPERH